MTPYYWGQEPLANFSASFRTPPLKPKLFLLPGGLAGITSPRMVFPSPQPAREGPLSSGVQTLKIGRAIFHPNFQLPSLRASVNLDHPWCVGQKACRAFPLWRKLQRSKEILLQGPFGRDKQRISLGFPGREESRALSEAVRPREESADVGPEHLCRSFPLQRPGKKKLGFSRWDESRFFW